MTELAAHSGRIRRWFPGTLKGKLFLSVVLFFCLLILTECGLRFFLGLGNPVQYQSDPLCNYLPLSNQSTYRFGKLNVINAFGQRSSPLPLTKESGHLRVEFIGDSITYGTTYVDQTEIFTSRLAAELPKQLGQPVDIMNASAGGWAIGNELGYLQSHGTYGADLVIFVLNTGDLTQPFTRMPLVPNSSYTNARPLTAIGELWERYLYPRLSGSTPSVDPGSVAGNSELPMEDILGSLGKARLLAESKGARFAIVYCPMGGQAWAKANAGRYASFVRWCSEQKVPLLDLTETFKADTADHIYFDQGVGHLRPRGHELAANAMMASWSMLNGSSPSTQKF